MGLTALTIASTTIALVLILNRSTFFKPLREYFTTKRNDSDSWFWWFLDEVFGCELCMSVWMSVVAALVWEYQLWFVIYCGYGVTISYLYFRIADYVKKY